MKTTRTEREHLLDELTRGAGRRRERAIRAQAETDPELGMLLEADAAITRAVERDRLSLTGDRTRPGSRILAKLADTPVPGPTASVTTVGTLRPRDIITAGAILAALIVGMLFTINIESGDVAPPVPAAAPKSGNGDAASTPEEKSADKRRGPTQEPTGNGNTSIPARTERATTPSASRPAATPPAAATRPLGRETPSAIKPEASHARRDSAAAAAPPPVFNDDKVNFEVRVEK